MRVSVHIVEKRREQLAEFLQGNAYASLQEVRARFNTSEATARRDLAALAVRKQIVRTYGGAVTEYNQRFPSFHERETVRAPAKRRIAEAARGLIEAGATCFLDFGTTIYALAEALRRRPVEGVKIVTNSLPVAELLSLAPGLRVNLLGGELLARQSALLGSAARKAVRFHAIDQAFFSAEAADPSGVWNSQREVVRLQQRVMARARQNILCLDGGKLGQVAPSFLAPWSGFNLILSNVGPARWRNYPPAKRRSV